MLLASKSVRLSGQTGGLPTDACLGHSLDTDRLNTCHPRKNARDFEFGSHCHRIASDVKKIRAKVLR